MSLPMYRPARNFNFRLLEERKKKRKTRKKGIQTRKNIHDHHKTKVGDWNPNDNCKNWRSNELKAYNYKRCEQSRPKKKGYTVDKLA
jgi:hypothetical protein